MHYLKNVMRKRKEEKYLFLILIMNGMCKLNFYNEKTTLPQLIM